jgi:hypothetical protein
MGFYASNLIFLFPIKRCPWQPSSESEASPPENGIAASKKWFRKLKRAIVVDTQDEPFVQCVSLISVSPKAAAGWMGCLVHSFFC